MRPPFQVRRCKSHTYMQCWIVRRLTSWSDGDFYVFSSDHPTWREAVEAAR